ncbi:MAG: hypothetical protein JJE21_03940 [Spirochaetaceae bacterium]|nr:hypothetical protein [Spirochaetaceae bacterium]
MKKKILASLLIASIAITGLFAYQSSNVVLNTTILPNEYTFELQKAGASLGNSYTEVVPLNSTGGTTDNFSVVTIADGNINSRITFKTAITTGQFISTDSSAEIQNTGWYPVIKDYSGSVNNQRQEVVSFNATDYLADGAFKEPSLGSYSVEFKPGKHFAGTEIARFALQYKGDDEIVAGSYQSTTIIEITT